LVGGTGRDRQWIDWSFERVPDITYLQLHHGA
jgi:hypothetical protein